MQKYLIWCSCLLVSCAKIVPPSGGPDENIAPTVLSTTPLNYSTQFREREIVFVFDEFVVLKDPANTISIIPSLNKPPKIRFEGKKMHFVFSEKLKENTTYQIKMYGAIADQHEGAVLNKFSYIFSTGDKIDSGKIGGKSINALTNEEEKACLCVATENIDSFYKGKYLGRDLSAEDGTFQFENLKEKQLYEIYCFKDENKNNLWENDEKIGFVNRKVTTKENLLVPIVDYNNDQKIISLKNEKPGKIEIVFAKIPIDAKITFDKLKDKNVVAQKEEKKIILFFDTTYQVKEKLSIEAKGLPKEEKEVFLISETYKGYQLRKNTYFTKTRMETNVFDPSNGVTLWWEYPIASIDTTKIRIKEDTVREIIYKARIYKTQIIIDADWKIGKKYKFEIAKNAIQNSYFQENDSLILFFKAAAKKEKSAIALNIKDIEKDKQYLLIEKQGIEKNAGYYIIKNKERVKLTIPKLDEGTYSYILIYDENRNGQWDKGKFKDKIPPEKAIVLTTIKLVEKIDQEKTISLKEVNKKQ